jgi:TRAP-type uncharacterized transport system substrate-binding protein
MVEKGIGFGYSVLPGGFYKNYPNALDSIGYPTVLSARKDLPEDAIYKITKAFWENYQETWKINPNFENYIKPENAISGLALPLHKGAYKYYKEKGYQIPKHLMPID